MAKINPIGIGIFRGAPTQADIIEFSNLLLQFKTRGLGAKLYVAFLLF